MRGEGGRDQREPEDDASPGGGTLDDATLGSVVTDDEPHERSAAGADRRVEGLVTAVAPGFFEVAAGGRSYLCTLRGRLRKPRPLPPTQSRRGGVPIAAGGSANKPARASGATLPAQETPSGEHPAQPPSRVAPGDRVLITPLAEHEGVIEEVLPRRAALVRSRRERAEERVMLANPDLAVLVFATREPEPHFNLLDRYLALCEHAGVQAVICINKDDLGVPGEVGTSVRQYAALGYPVLYTSAATGDGIEALRGLLAGKISLLTGESGVGKSSLTNLLAPGAGQRTGEISQATGFGRHTTTGVRLLPLAEGGWLADSAGIRELSLWNVPSADLARCFVELRSAAGQCIYEDCAHSADEEGCALRAVLVRGDITLGRWASFERLLAEARADEKPEWARR